MTDLVEETKRPSLGGSGFNGGLGVKHSILTEYVDDEGMILKTTHEKITYDELTEEFIVDCGEGTWVAVLGKNRFSMAIKIANLLHPNGKNQLTSL